MSEGNRGEEMANDPRLMAAIDLLGRAGAKDFQIRYSDDEKPIIWMCCATWADGSVFTGSGLVPAQAAVDLAEHALDGGHCAHCNRPSGVSVDWKREHPFRDLICWYIYDPETKAFRRSCEGETEGLHFGYDRETGRRIRRNDICPCGSGKKFKACHGA